MARFSYQARNRDGGSVAGTMDAADSAAVASLLAQSGMVPVRIVAASAAPRSEAGRKLAKWSTFGSTVPREELMNFCRQMHTLLRSGVPITRALAALYESSTHAGFADILMDLRQKLESGRELSNAMQAHSVTFDAFFRSMVRIGETTGRLDEIFVRLFEHLEFEKEMSQRVKSATRYPSFVILALAGAMVVINVFVIPSFAAVFKSFHADLPIVTQLLIAFSDFTIRFWPALLLGTIGAVVAFRMWLRTPLGRLTWDTWTLLPPVIGPLLRKAVLARFARSLSLALRSGVPIIEALDAAIQTTDNRYVRQRIEEMRTGVDRGESVTGAARRAGVFTPVVLQMISIGEESGTIDELLQEVALAYERDVAYELKTLSDYIEPVLVVFLGIMVLILALGVFLPMWDLGKAALGRPAH